MSVYTTVSRGELVAFLADYAVGSLLAFDGISDGIDNTNYWVETESGRYVLTLFEHYDAEDLDYFLGLVALLAESGLPCAHPLACTRGRYLRELCGRPAALVDCLPGQAVTEPTASQCTAVGDALGRIHLVAAGYGGRHQDKYGPDWFERTSRAVMPNLPAADQALLRDELRHSQECRYPDLPAGVIHADLFRDNALFKAGNLTGIIDFYSACNGVLLYDLAICVNDWCVTPAGVLNPTAGQAFLTAYHAVRRLEVVERTAWPDILRTAALRFWLSRLHDKHFPREGDLIHFKNPDRFRDILRLRQADPEAANALWPVDPVAVGEVR